MHFPFSKVKASSAEQSPDRSDYAHFSFSSFSREI